MGNADVKNRMYMSITANNAEEVLFLVQNYPELANEPVSDDEMTTALTRAAFLNRPHLLSLLLEHGADVNKTGRNGISPLMWAAGKGHLDCIIVLLDAGGDLSQTGPSEMTAADFAVLYGRYAAACFLYIRGAKATKASEEFERIKKDWDTVFVDFSGLLMSLDCGIPPEVVPSFVAPPLDKTPPLQDPISDPSETWAQWVHRVLEFQEPPLVERSSVPSEQQPQNKLLGRFKVLLGLENGPTQVVPELVRMAD